MSPGLRRREKNTTRFQIPYVDRLLDVEVPERNLIFDVAPRDVPPVEDFDGTLRRALSHPIGTPPLAQMLRPGMKVIIISDDNTRITPTKQLIPILLDFLNEAGIPDKNIQIIISSGTHRAMTPAELDEKYGQPVMSRVPILPHRYKDPDSLVSYGTTRRGTKILVNRHVVEADFCIAVGNIIPHHPTGWSAGAKAVLPGVGGEETVAQMHFLGSKDPALGRLDTEMRREMEDYAEKVGLNFILNVILNREGGLVGAVAGHFIHAHRAGVEISKGVYGVPIPELADMTLSSTSPVDFDFFQGDKGITSAELSTRPGGEIVLVSGCLEGVSPTHPELAEYVGKMTNPRIWDMARQGKAPDPLTAAEAIVINDIKARMDITIASEGLSPELCAQMGFRHVPPAALDSYLYSRLAEDPALKIGILRHSAEVLPIPFDPNGEKST
ncbi:MAG: nickel-dependent lactate racemase [Candidatus Atribacteria bacterium]|nr:nickel-dependent lactate racemase [Candidatus Atribacteria bacterium]